MLRIKKDTADLRRHFEGTGAAEFLYSCLERTVEMSTARDPLPCAGTMKRWAGLRISSKCRSLAQPR
jgi:hypothetical protein